MRQTSVFFGFLLSFVMLSVVLPGSNMPAQPLDSSLVFPGLLENQMLLAGNPLATYIRMVDLEREYLESAIFSKIYPEIRLGFEEFLGEPAAGTRAMSLPAFRNNSKQRVDSIPEGYTPQSALEIIERRAADTRLVIWGEEHHLPQTRSLYEQLLQVLWNQGYHYLAAETFDSSVMDTTFHAPSYQSGYYLRDPVFATAVRKAIALGYVLVAYDTREVGPPDDASFRDRTQAENLVKHIFAKDPDAKVFVIAGRGHSSEIVAADGWTPMASVLKLLTGIDPLTIYAPTMTARMSLAEEHPLYRDATAKDLLKQPTIFVNSFDQKLLGTNSFDAYIFWPRPQLIDHRPDWMQTVLGRHPFAVPELLLHGSGALLVQAFPLGDPPSTVPVDQVIVWGPGSRPSLMLPSGNYWLRSVDRYGNELGPQSAVIR